MLRCVHVAKEDFYAEGGVRVSNEDAATAVQGMKQSVAAGELFLEPGVTEACAGHCETLMSEIDGVRALFGDIQNMSGFGDFVSGEQLRAGFETKARTAADVLLSYAKVVSDMRANFHAAGAAYAERDSANSGNLENAGGSIAG